ncbi:MAG: hypothetical protein ACSHWW_10525 [Nonlabens sp.]|uniref:hypothetical protein n=1 Tax=Nonlabens sp. TaxID=1888209 RepID=UPI003EF38119
MNKSFSLLLLFLSLLVNAQVGVNESLPDAAAALDINSQMTMNYGGLKLPVVNAAQKAQIPVSSTSDGIMIYVNYGTSSCLEIYDALNMDWQQIRCSTVGPTTLYSEDFNSYSSGTGIDGSGNSGDYPAGVSKWTLTDLNNTISSGDHAYTQSGLLEANDTNGPIQLETQLINISGYTAISFSVDLSGAGPLEYDTSLHSTDATNVLNDYINVEYSIDGAPFTIIADFNGNGTIHHTLVAHYAAAGSGTAPFFPNETVTQSGLNGSSLSIRITLQNWASDEFLYIDNIIVTGI